MKKVLVTMAGPSMLPILRTHSLPTFERYARENGYEVKVIELPSDDTVRNSDAQKQARWQKVPIIKETLASSDAVVWFDADIMIRRYNDDIVSHLSADDYQGLVLHEVPVEDRVNPDTGVWVMKNTEKSFRFLDAVESIGVPEGRWADQGAVMRALGWKLGDPNSYRGARMPEVATEFLTGTAWLPIGWNQPYSENRLNPEVYAGMPLDENPYALHFSNMSADERLQYMGTVVAG